MQKKTNVRTTISSKLIFGEYPYKFQTHFLTKFQNSWSYNEIFFFTLYNWTSGKKRDVIKRHLQSSTY